MAPPPTPELNTDAVSEILLRLPPDDPGGLVRASAVCKTWLRTLTDPAFLCRYRDFHRPTPRVLGFHHNDSSLARFVPTTAFRPHAAAAAHRTCSLLYCRHCRVLLYDNDDGCKDFVVWDPVTGRECRIPDESHDSYSNQAVLCAAATAGCNHSTCSGGTFLIACADTRSNNICESYACFYSSETGAWSEQTSLMLWYCYGLEERPAALVGDALYFDGSFFHKLLRYDVLGGGGLLVMALPPGIYDHSPPNVMTAANGGLGLVTFDNDCGTLAQWSADKMTGPYDDGEWSRIIVIDLQELLPMIDIIGISSAWLSGFAEEANLVFLSTDDDGIFTIDLKSLLVRKVCEIGGVNHVFPYESFYTPAGNNAPRASQSQQCLTI